MQYKLDDAEVLKEIKKYNNAYPGNQIGSALLAGMFKVSIEAIRKCKERLERDGKIKRIRKDKYFNDYVIIED